jgi:lipoate-protein ligase A
VLHISDVFSIDADALVIEQGDNDRGGCEHLIHFLVQNDAFVIIGYQQ